LQYSATTERGEVVNRIEAARQRLHVMREEIRLQSEQRLAGHNVIRFLSDTPKIGLFSQDRAKLEEHPAHAAD
jgi:hypothetical protein